MNVTNSISVNRLAELHKETNGAELDVIDVRTPAEFREVHIKIARNEPLDQLNPDDVMKHRNGHANDPLYIICRSGNRSSQAYKKFIDAGYTNVINVEGGTLSWDAAGLPVIRGRKTMSLERQVRIAAGFLVLLGAVLGFFAHPWFIGISAFVGAGLMFAGITDTCGMAMFLARMPWNQVNQEGATCTPA